MKQPKVTRAQAWFIVAVCLVAIPFILWGAAFLVGILTKIAVHGFNTGF